MRVIINEKNYLILDHALKASKTRKIMVFRFNF